MLLTWSYGWTQDRDGDGGGIRTLAARVVAAVTPKSFQPPVSVITSCGQNLFQEILPRYDVAGGAVGGGLWMFGYSYGGGLAIKTCWELEEVGIPVEKLVLLDPMPRWAWGQFQNFPLLGPKVFQLPKNVRSAVCFTQNLAWGLHGLQIRGQVAEAGNVVNRDIKPLGLKHEQLPGDTRIQQMIFEAMTGETLTGETL